MLTEIVLVVLFLGGLALYLKSRKKAPGNSSGGGTPPREDQHDQQQH